VTGQT